MTKSRFRVGIWLAVVAAALVCAVAAVVALTHGAGEGMPGSPLLSPGTARRPAATTDPLARGSAVALGVNLDTPSATALQAFTTLTGARPWTVMWYQTWDEPLFYRSQIQPVAALGAVPLITWDPTYHGQGLPLSLIAQGHYDSYIASAAKEAAAWKGRIYIRFAHEMNLSGSAWGPGHGGNTPQAFVAAWRHVVTIFRDEHATNVEWVWSPNVYCSGSCPFTSFYPGDSWVDWAALDGYNYASLSNDPWQTFAQIFGPSYQILTHLSDKPVMIGETSSAEAGGSKAQWITGMTQALASEFPRVRAIVWFQRVKETDWRVDSSPQSLDAFRAVARSRLFQVSASRQAAVS